MIPGKIYCRLDAPAGQNGIARLSALNRDSGKVAVAYGLINRNALAFAKASHTKSRVLDVYAQRQLVKTAPSNPKVEATPLTRPVNSGLRPTGASKPLAPADRHNAAPTRPAAARLHPAPPGSPLTRATPADSHSTGKPRRIRRDERAQRAAPAGGEAKPNPAAPALETKPVAGTSVLDTTAQLRQSPATALQNRARSKYLTDAIVQGLMGLGEWDRIALSYASTARCADELVQDGVRVQGKYCRQRWCLVCNRIRTAKLLQTYLPEMLTWADKYFVTLTVPNVQGHELHSVIGDMLAAMRPIARAIRHTDGLELRAVRKLETTYSIRRGDYHPHLDVRRCEGRKGAVELFKYFTKLIVRGLDGERTAPHPAKLHTIFMAVRGRRTFQPMGFVSQVKVSADDEALELDAGTVSPIKPDARGRIRWKWIGDDWLDYGSGELLSGFTPTDSMRELVNRITADARAAPP